jgi:hypothetical protein
MSRECQQQIRSCLDRRCRNIIASKRATTEQLLLLRASAAQKRISPYTVSLSDGTWCGVGCVRVCVRARACAQTHRQTKKGAYFIFWELEFLNRAKQTAKGEKATLRAPVRDPKVCYITRIIPNKSYGANQITNI